MATSDEPAGKGNTTQTPSFQVRIPVEWDPSDKAPIIYANQVMISHMGPEFFLTFGVVAPPPTTDSLPDSLRIHPQVRIAVSRDAMPAMVSAMQESLDRYRTALQARTRAAPEREAGTGSADGKAP